MPTHTYVERRSQLHDYFDRTAVEAWSRLTSDAPVGRIRATVRAGRDQMRDTLLGFLPRDLSGRRILDAGCGTGALAIEAARRGAHVVAIDLSPTLVGLAHERSELDFGTGHVEFRVGDMFDPALGQFDHVVAMDSLIHYRAPDVVRVLAAHTGACADACRRAVVPARQPFAGDRTGGTGLAHRENRAGLTAVGLDRRAHASRGCRFLHVAGAGTDPQMSTTGLRMADSWRRVGTRFLPFADVASPSLPLARLLRLSLFQVSVAMAAVLLTGTLNRVMIVEMQVPAWLVSTMVALPLLFAPMRAFIGFKSDTHRSALGWRRVPYLWFGTLLQFGGLAIMPFALIILAGDTHGPAWIGMAAAALAFLLTGAGMHTAQTAGLALAADLAEPAVRPRVVALLYVMLLVGTVLSALVYGTLLSDFSPLRLIQVIQGAAIFTLGLNLLALWKQEARGARQAPANDVDVDVDVSFVHRFREFASNGRRARFLAAVGLGTAAFTMQDVLLEPYGAEILHLPVGDTTMLTAFQAAGTLAAFALAARRLMRGADPHRLAALGLLAGIAAFSAVVFAAALASPMLFRAGTVLIGLGGGLFAVGTLTAAMDVEHRDHSGLALGAWGAMQATAAGLGIALGGLLRDVVGGLASHGVLGDALAVPVTGYSFVYHCEIVLLFCGLVAIGPLVRSARVAVASPGRRFGLAEFPG
jgi:MFS transporter, BCD family, chlorophyll transporter